MIRNETPEQDFESGAEIRLTTLLSTFSLTRLSPSKLEVLALEMGSYFNQNYIKTMIY